MAVTNLETVAQYTGNGTTTTFALSASGVPIPFFAATDWSITLFDTTALQFVSPAPVLNGGSTYDYQIATVTSDTATGEISAANVVFNNAPLGNHRVTGQRDTPATQGVEQTDNSKTPAATQNGALDRAMFLIQQIQQRALMLPLGDNAASGNVLATTAEQRANLFVGFDTTGENLIVAGLVGAGIISAAMVPVVEASSVAAALALLGGAPIGSSRRILGKITGATLDSTADQAFAAIGALPAKFRITAFYATNANGSLAASAAVGGAWTGAGKTGTNVVPITEPYTSLTAATTLYEFGLATGTLEQVFAALPIWALSTAGAAGETADIYVEGIGLP